MSAIAVHIYIRIVHFLSTPESFSCTLQDMGDMHVLALLQQAQVQRAAQDALDCMDKQAVQAGAASEQLQELAMKVLEP